MRSSFVVALVLAAVGCGGPNPRVEIVTNQGKIQAELFANEAPISVKNFLRYVEDKHFDGTVFHRVIPDFMIQGGGFDADMKEKPTRAPIRNEAGNGLENKRGTLAMARTDLADSATSQFFINVKDNDFLDRANARDHVGYAVFGKVTDGMDVVDRIRRTPTDPKDVPREPMIIESIRQLP